MCLIKNRRNALNWEWNARNSHSRNKLKSQGYLIDQVKHHLLEKFSGLHPGGAIKHENPSTRTVDGPPEQHIYH